MKKTALLKWSLLLLIVLASGCALYRNDRSFVPETKYSLARQYFMQTGSLDLTQRHLRDLEWRRAEINETIYRLRKEFKVLPEELPVPTENALAVPAQ